jgi:hypothetical protein
MATTAAAAETIQSPEIVQAQQKALGAITARGSTRTLGGSSMHQYPPPIPLLLGGAVNPITGDMYGVPSHSHEIICLSPLSRRCHCLCHRTTVR